MGCLAILSILKPITIALIIPCAGFLYHRVITTAPAVTTTTVITSADIKLEHPITLYFVIAKNPDDSQEVNALQVDELLKQERVRKQVFEIPPGIRTRLKMCASAKQIALVVSDGAVREKFVLTAGKKYRININRKAVLVKRLKRK